MSQAVRVVLGCLVFLLALLASSSQAEDAFFPIVSSKTLSSSLPDTGVFACGNGTSNAAVCPGQTDVYFGQDANYNPASRTPIFIDNSDGTVTELVTGLMWMDDCLTGSGSGYTWSEAANQCDAQSIAGHQDWRLPGILELVGMSHFGRTNPALDPTFDCGWNADFWSGDSYAANTSNAWKIFTTTGQSGSMAKTALGYVRCVRGAARKASSWRVDGDVATDKSTGLMWMRDDAASTMNWQAALAECQSLSLAGYEDWRLPDIKELWTLINLTRTSSPLVDPNVFTSESSHYWASSPCASGAQLAWLLHFGTGLMEMGNKSGAYYVRCVRGGP